jgi:hypothetical protein
MVGGLIVSQALTLFTTPVIYLYLDQLSEWASSWRSSPRENNLQASLIAGGGGGRRLPFSAARSRGPSTRATSAYSKSTDPPLT